jgi:hypothetical protein
MSGENSTGGLGQMMQRFSQVSTELPDMDVQEETPFQTVLRQAQRDQLAKIHNLFTSELGRDVLAWMKALTTERPVIDPEHMFGVDPKALMARAFFREGENETVRRIEKAIDDYRYLSEQDAEDLSSD